jgi:hypothetical protein
MTESVGFIKNQQVFQKTTFEKYYKDTPLHKRAGIWALGIIANIPYLFAYVFKFEWAGRAIIWLHDLAEDLSNVEAGNNARIVLIAKELIYNPNKAQTGLHYYDPDGSMSHLSKVYPKPDKTDSNSSKED